MRCNFFLYALFFSSRNDTIDMEPVKVKQVICFFISRELIKKLIIFSLHLLIYQLRYILILYVSRNNYVRGYFHTCGETAQVGMSLSMRDT